MYPLLVLSCTYYYMFTYSTCLCVEEVFGVHSRDLVVWAISVTDSSNMVQYPMCSLLSIVSDVLHVLSLTAEGDDRENL